MNLEQLLAAAYEGVKKALAEITPQPPQEPLTLTLKQACDYVGGNIDAWKRRRAAQSELNGHA